MGLIQNHILSGLADRLAQQATLLKSAINTTTPGSTFYKRVHTGVPTDGDFDVENDLISAANGIDENTMSGNLFKNVYSTFFSDLETHGINQNAVSFDSWLNISGVNVHPNFEDAWYQSKNTHLDARNVFFSDANILVATLEVTSSGVGTYTAGTAVGTGTGKVSSTNYAAAKMVLVPVKDVGAANQVNLRLTKENPTDGSDTDHANIVVGGSVTSGIQFQVNGSGTFLNVSNMVPAGGASGDVFRVYALLERGISL